MQEVSHIEKLSITESIQSAQKLLDEGMQILRSAHVTLEQNGSANSLPSVSELLTKYIQSNTVVIQISVLLQDVDDSHADALFAAYHNLQSQSQALWLLMLISYQRGAKSASDKLPSLPALVEEFVFAESAPQTIKPESSIDSVLLSFFARIPEDRLHTVIRFEFANSADRLRYVFDDILFPLVCLGSYISDLRLLSTEYCALLQIHTRLEQFLSGIQKCRYIISESECQRVESLKELEEEISMVEPKVPRDLRDSEVRAQLDAFFADMDKDGNADPKKYMDEAAKIINERIEAEETTKMPKVEIEPIDFDDFLAVFQHIPVVWGLRQALSEGFNAAPWAEKALLCFLWHSTQTTFIAQLLTLVGDRLNYLHAHCHHHICPLESSQDFDASVLENGGVNAQPVDLYESFIKQCAPLTGARWHRFFAELQPVLSFTSKSLKEWTNPETHAQTVELFGKTLEFVPSWSMVPSMRLKNAPLYPNLQEYLALGKTQVAADEQMNESHAITVEALAQALRQPIFIGSEADMQHFKTYAESTDDMNNEPRESIPLPRSFYETLESKVDTIHAAILAGASEK